MPQRVTDLIKMKRIIYRNYLYCLNSFGYLLLPPQETSSQQAHHFFPVAGCFQGHQELPALVKLHIERTGTS